MTIARSTAISLAVAAGLSIAVADLAEARLGGGKSFGSRGSRTFNAPPPTNTAPSAAPIERSMTQKGATTTAQNATPGASAATQGSRFGGMRGLLMGGLFAVALGSIFGFGALASALGFLLQFALIAGIVYLAFAFFRSRGQPASARGGVRGAAVPRPKMPNLASMGGAAGATSALVLGKDDFDHFERLLGEIQTAYSREDADALGDKATPEMLSHFLQELADNAKQGVRNEISDVKLLQGDLSEAWRENGSDYATVALRYALKDVTVEKATGRVVSGDAGNPAEAVELWTFRRDDRGSAEGWQLSAIQQAA